jgi:hypothetical protein
MAKGTHSKRHKYNMRLIRKLMEEKVFGPRDSATSDRLLKRTYGTGDESIITRKKNAFRYPNDPNSEFPQEKRPVYLDRRAASLPIQYRIKNHGEKKKNRVKREMEELLRKEIEKANGNFNDGKIIDIDDMGELVKDVENMDIEGKNKNKKYKEKDIGMDLDEVIGNKRHVIKKIKRNGYRHKRKSKNIMNF